MTSAETHRTTALALLALLAAVSACAENPGKGGKKGNQPATSTQQPSHSSNQTGVGETPSNTGGTPQSSPVQTGNDQQNGSPASGIPSGNPAPAMVTLEQALMHSLVFNWEGYLRTYPDLRNFGIQTQEAATKHWMEHGSRECRDGGAPLFSVTRYMALNKDVGVAFTGKCQEAIHHFVSTGFNEGRTIHVLLDKRIFNWAGYVIQNADLKALNTFELAANHWLQYGIDECRNGGVASFSAQRYLTLNQDLRNAGITTCRKAAEHYVTSGADEGRKGI